jgi:hypothetical protein
MSDSKETLPTFDASELEEKLIGAHRWIVTVLEATKGTPVDFYAMTALEFIMEAQLIAHRLKALVAPVAVSEADGKPKADCYFCRGEGRAWVTHFKDGYEKSEWQECTQCTTRTDYRRLTLTIEEKSHE